MNYRLYYYRKNLTNITIHYLTKTDNKNVRILSRFTQAFLPPEISLEAIKAVSGTARTIPILAEMPLMVSRETKAFEYK